MISPLLLHPTAPPPHLHPSLDIECLLRRGRFVFPRRASHFINVDLMYGARPAVALTLNKKAGVAAGCYC